MPTWPQQLPSVKAPVAPVAPIRTCGFDFIDNIQKAHRRMRQFFGISRAAFAV